MAVTIDEMHVEVADTPVQAAAPASPAEPKKDMSLSYALEILRERMLRLRAD